MAAVASMVAPDGQARANVRQVLGGLAPRTGLLAAGGQTELAVVQPRGGRQTVVARLAEARDRAPESASGRIGGQG